MIQERRLINSEKSYHADFFRSRNEVIRWSLFESFFRSGDLSLFDYRTGDFGLRESVSTGAAGVLMTDL